MEIKIIREPMTLAKVHRAAQESYGDMVKAVADIERGFLALGGELHADAEAVLLADGSAQEDLWGINIYPEKSRDAWVEFTSMINIRPRANNRSMEIQDPIIQKKILDIVDKLIQKS